MPSIVLYTTVPPTVTWHSCQPPGGAKQSRQYRSGRVKVAAYLIVRAGPEAHRLESSSSRPRVETTQQGRGSTDRKLRDSHAPNARQSRVKSRQKESSASCNNSLERQAVKQRVRAVWLFRRLPTDGPQLLYARRETHPTSKPKFPDIIDFHNTNIHPLLFHHFFCARLSADTDVLALLRPIFPRSPSTNTIQFTTSSTLLPRHYECFL